MTRTEATRITGGLSTPSKMPCRAYGLPAGAQCPTGSKLMLHPGSVCSRCYAQKGKYRFNNVVEAQNRRLASLRHPKWIEAMTKLIGG